MWSFFPSGVFPHVISSNHIKANPKSTVFCLSDFMPHLSLYYGDLAQESKEKAIGLVEAEFRHAVCEKEFIVSSLCLYSTDTSDKSLKSWKKVAEFPLGGGSIIKP